MNAEEDGPFTFVDVPSSRLATAGQAVLALLGMTLASVVAAVVISAIRAGVLVVVAVAAAAAFASMLDGIYR